MPGNHKARPAPGNYGLKGGNLSGTNARTAGHKGPAPLQYSLIAKRPVGAKDLGGGSRDAKGKS